MEKAFKRSKVTALSGCWEQQLLSINAVFGGAAKAVVKPCNHDEQTRLGVESLRSSKDSFILPQMNGEWSGALTDLITLAGL